MAGDVVGNPGRKACRDIIPRLRQDESLDAVIVNGENVAGGSGLTESTCRELFECGVDVITSGDHAFRKPGAAELFNGNQRILRPANFPALVPGRGSLVWKTASGVRFGVLNLMGRVFMKPLDCPFAIADREIRRLRDEVDIILVDFHAEATAEKKAMGWFLDGRVSALFGTHTHVPTADECILPSSTAYVTDIGMCGAHRSVIGRKIEHAIEMFVTQMPIRLEVASEDIRLTGVMVEIDPSSGRAVSIRRIQECLDHANARMG